MRTLPVPACALALVAAIPCGHIAAQSEPLTLAPFGSVELRNGSHAVLRYGPTQRVTFLKGSPDETQVTVAPGGDLIVDKCRSKCSREYELQLEIVTPSLARITLAHGGIIQSRGTFPRQTALSVFVDNGGTIDIRSMSAESVTASVLSGGRIFTRPLTSLIARVEDGGNITYWGDARVTPSIRHGGVVERGAPSDFDLSLSELGSPFARPKAHRP